jgi:hypothetical protein
MAELKNSVQGVVSAGTCIHCTNRCHCSCLCLCCACSIATAELPSTSRRHSINRASAAIVSKRLLKSWMMSLTGDHSTARERRNYNLSARSCVLYNIYCVKRDLWRNLKKNNISDFPIASTYLQSMHTCLCTYTVFY